MITNNITKDIILDNRLIYQIDLKIILILSYIKSKNSFIISRA